MILFAAVFYIATGIGGCEWPIYAREVRMDVTFRQFSNHPPNSASLSDSMIFLIMLYYKWTDTFSGGIYCIGVMDFGHIKKPALPRESGSDI